MSEVIKMVSLIEQMLSNKKEIFIRKTYEK